MQNSFLRVYMLLWFKEATSIDPINELRSIFLFYNVIHYMKPIQRDQWYDVGVPVDY